MKPSSRTGWTRTAGLVVAGGIVLATLTPAPAAPQAAAPPAQPVALPHKDLLEVDAASDTQGGKTRIAAAPESTQEIRRSTDPAGGGTGRKNIDTPSPAGAGEDARPVGRQAAARGLWRVSDFMPLFIVLALVGAAAWVVKRYLPARRLVTGSGVMEVVARLPLSPKQSLVLVKMGQRMVLVGLSPERVNTVCLLDDPEQVAELAGRIASHSRDSAAREFRHSLDQQADRFDGGEDEDLPLQAAGGVRGLLEKVRRLSKSGVT